MMGVCTRICKTYDDDDNDSVDTNTINYIHK